MEVCPTCDSEFSSSRGVRVHHAQAHDERLPNRECVSCGEEFYSEHEQRYCTNECREESVSFAGADNPNWRGGKETTECELCEAEFEYYPSEKPGRFCSDCVAEESWRHTVELCGEDNPRWTGGRLDLECAVCDTEFQRYPSNVTGEVALCDEDCRAEWLSEAFTGEGHPNWRGGGNEPYGKGWADVRRRALERDGHECVVCGTTREELGRNPDVHHVTPVRVFVESETCEREDAHFLGNVVSLCPSCHRKAEFGKIPKEALRTRFDTVLAQENG